MRQIILDTETTGLSTAEGHRVIEIGCIELINRKVTGKTFHRYINPQRPIDAGAVSVHGITTEFLADKPLFTDIVNEFIDFVKEAELIIHNAEFDVGFLNYEFKLLDQNLLTLQDYCSVVDTLSLARQRHPGQRNSLDALCKRYAIDNSSRDFHGALLDARLLADVYLAMTGGQTTFFSETKFNNPVSTQEVHIPTINAVVTNLKILLADDAEQNEHLKFLEKIKEKSAGICLWED